MDSDTMVGTAFICDNGHVIGNCFEIGQASCRYCPKCSGEIHSSCRFCGARIPGNKYRKFTTSELDGKALSALFYNDNDDLDNEMYLQKIYRPCLPQLLNKITDDNKTLYCVQCGMVFSWTINMLKQKTGNTDLCKEDKVQFQIYITEVQLDEDRNHCSKI